jgi:hypothetical protein
MTRAGLIQPRRPIRTMLDVQVKGLAEPADAEHDGLERRLVDPVAVRLEQHPAGGDLLAQDPREYG